MPSASTTPNEKPAQLMWTAFILMFFCIQATIWTIAICITSQDSSHAVVAGYDEQALSWDEVKVARQESAELGWHSQLQIDHSGDIRGYRKITLRLKNAHRAPIQNASVLIRAFHRAHAADPQQIEFREMEPGVYSSTVQVNRFGQWSFSGSAIAGEKTFLIDETISIQPAKG